MSCYQEITFPIGLKLLGMGKLERCIFMMSSKKPFQNKYRGENKLLSDKDIVDIERLITLLNDVIDFLINDGSKEIYYTDFTKSLMIMKNRDATG